MANLSVESLDDGILIKSNQGLDQSFQYDATVAGPNAMLVHKVGVNNSIGMLDVDSDGSSAETQSCGPSSPGGGRWGTGGGLRCL